MILVTGATGNIGGEVARQLKTAGQSVRALVRTPSKATALSDLGIELAQGDFETPAALSQAVNGIDHVFLTVPDGPEQFDLLQNFLDAAKQSSIRHIVMLSGAEAAADSPRLVSQWHWRMEQQMRASGIPFTFLQPLYIMVNVLRYVEPARQTGRFYGPMAGDVKFGMVSPQDIAGAAVATLTQPGHEGKSYLLSGPELVTFNEVAQVLQRLLHRDVTYVEAAPEAIRAQILGNGQPEWRAQAAITTFPPTALVNTTVADLTGHAPLTLAHYLERTLTPVV